IDVDYLIDNQSDSTWTGSLFGKIKRHKSGAPSSSSATGMATFLGAAYWSAENDYTKLKFGDMDDTRLKQTVDGGWIAWLQHYFVSAWIPSAEQQHVYQTRKDSQ